MPSSHARATPSPRFPKANSASWTERVDESINNFVDPVATRLTDFVFYEIHAFGKDIPWIVAWLVVAGLVFTVYFGAAQVRHLGVALRLVRGKYEQSGAPGEVSHFRR